MVGGVHKEGFLNSRETTCFCKRFPCLLSDLPSLAHLHSLAWESHFPPVTAINHFHQRVCLEFCGQVRGHRSKCMTFACSRLKAAG